MLHSYVFFQTKVTFWEFFNRSECSFASMIPATQPNSAAWPRAMFIRNTSLETRWHWPLRPEAGSSWLRPPSPKISTTVTPCPRSSSKSKPIRADVRLYPSWIEASEEAPSSVKPRFSCPKPISKDSRLHRNVSAATKLPARGHRTSNRTHQIRLSHGQKLPQGLLRRRLQCLHGCRRRQSPQVATPAPFFGPSSEGFFRTD